MDADTRTKIRQAVDARQRELVARGALRPLDPGRLVADAAEAEAKGYPEIGAAHRRLAVAVEKLYAQGISPERADDIVYRWLTR